MNTPTATGTPYVESRKYEGVAREAVFNQALIRDGTALAERTLRRCRPTTWRPDPRVLRVSAGDGESALRGARPDSPAGRRHGSGSVKRMITTRMSPKVL